MKKGIIYSVLLIVLFSCKNEDNQPLDNFRSSIYSELDKESDLNFLEETWENANRYRTRNKRRNFSGLDKYHQKLDQYMDLYSDCKPHLSDSLYLQKFEEDLLTLKYNYETPRGTYHYPNDGEDVSMLNPDDTANFTADKTLLQLILQVELSEKIRKLFLTELMDKSIQTHAYQLRYEEDFLKLEFIPNSSQAVWKKDEKAYLIADYYLTDAKGYTKVKIGDQLFDREPIIIKAPQKTGLHEITGSYFIKERGVEIEKPFRYRILVD